MESEPSPRKLADKHGRWLRLLIAGCALLILFAILRPARDSDSPADANEDSANARATSNDRAERTAWRVRFSRSATPSAPAPATAEEVVARKLSQFARSRREFVHALARRHNVNVPDDVERFFDAVESGNWEAIEAAFAKINGGDSSAGHNDKRPPGITHLWPAIIDAYGAAEQVHDWPAQQLLDYGNEILGALRPGMVYVGGTDNGRWIPELLNDTSDGERHVIVTQNGLADGTYLDYLRLQYDDRLQTLNQQDSDRAFAEYVADAQKRFEHDRDFPEEPKQVRPGENIQMVDGKVQVSGQVAVMAINEKLLHTLIQKNPDLSFALQESSSLRGTYSDALPLGPLMELGARDEQNIFTSDRATQYLDHWRQAADRILSDPQAAGSEYALKSYSHDTVSAGNLLASHNFNAEAEQAYRLAMQVWPENVRSAGGLADLLARTGRETEAHNLLEQFSQRHPHQQKELERGSAAWLIIGSPQSRRE